MNTKIEIELNKILTDKVSGSSELLGKIEQFFINYHLHFTDHTSLIKKIKKHFKSFENVQKFLIRLQSKADSKQFIKYLIRQIELERNVYKKIFENALPHIKNRKVILTISNSKTIFEILKLLNPNNKPKIIICESRPNFEGRILAKNLAEVNFEVQLITEAQTANYMRNVDCVIIGADSILKNGNAVNKVGSFQLAILCKHFKKPFYIIADKSKFSKRNNLIQKKESVSEIWKSKPQNILVNNSYFEIIPNQLITKIISD